MNLGLGPETSVYFVITLHKSITTVGAHRDQHRMPKTKLLLQARARTEPWSKGGETAAAASTNQRAT